MSWYPPWRSEDRYRWMKARPWVAALYFAFLLALPVAVVGGLTSIWGGIAAGTIFGLATWAVMGVGLKRRWAERPDAEHFDRPSVRHPWSRSSDRALRWLFAVSGVAVLILAITLVDRIINSPDRVMRIVVDVFSLLVWSWFAITARRERVRRLQRPS